MTHPATATLKSTGETVHKLADDARPQGGDSGVRFLCLLPPQSPGHNPRHQWIGADKLQFRQDR